MFGAYLPGVIVQPDEAVRGRRDQSRGGIEVRPQALVAIGLVTGYLDIVLHTVQAYALSPQSRDEEPAIAGIRQMLHNPGQTGEALEQSTALPIKQIDGIGCSPGIARIATSGDGHTVGGEGNGIDLPLIGRANGGSGSRQQ